MGREAGVPGRSQLTTRTPSSPSEYAIRRTATPARASAATPVTPSVNGGEGRLPGASTKLTNPVTSYVPLPAPKPVVVHVPPPVTRCGRPGLERKVPLPVSVIMLSHEDAAHADAFPPAKVVAGGGRLRGGRSPPWSRWL